MSSWLCTSLSVFSRPEQELGDVARIEITECRGGACHRSSGKSAPALGDFGPVTSSNALAPRSRAIIAL